MTWQATSPDINTSVSERTRRMGDIFREVVFVLIILAAWVTTRPFEATPVPVAGETTSDIVNQLTFSGLAVASVLALAIGNGRMLRPLLQVSYGLMLVWLVVGVLSAAIPASAFRALAFTLIVMFLAAALYGLPRDFERFKTLLFGTAAATLAVAWIGIFVFSDFAIHSDIDTFEPEHAGSWRGHLIHKNITGAMMAVLTIVGVFALRSGRKAVGLWLVIGGVVFLYFTRSKTSLGLLPIAIALAFVAEKIPSLFVRAGILLGPVAALNLLTLGSAINPGIAAFNKEYLKDPSFTGRLDIWRFGFEKFVERPWTGFGFESFWLSPDILRAESKLDLNWEVQNIIHGHNGYLDMLLTLGIPGILLVVYVFLVKPVWDYHHHKPTAANRQLATACLMIWLFASLCMCLEVFYFRRADPIWFALLIAVFGLRMAASYPLAQAEEPEPNRL
ncbi:MAG: O-antigen ligase family protein [Bosea sp. (in: a-proteobacteria)]